MHTHLVLDVGAVLPGGAGLGPEFGLELPQRAVFGGKWPVLQHRGFDCSVLLHPYAASCCCILKMLTHGCGCTVFLHWHWSSRGPPISVYSLACGIRSMALLARSAGVAVRFLIHARPTQASCSALPRPHGPTASTQSTALCLPIAPASAVCRLQRG